ncbi:MAG: hypothetical protein OS112_04290 [Methanoregula sp.]|nr:MAG: hypothetical protein OS112_04290 [Methanoregula sp.]
MDAPSFENLRRFFERIKNIGFFERLFFWRSFVSASHDAYSEYQQLNGSVKDLAEESRAAAEQNRTLGRDLETVRAQVGVLQQELAAERAQIKVINERISDKERERATLSATLAETQANSEKSILQLKAELAANLAKWDLLNTQYLEARETISQHVQREEGRLRDHEQRIAGLNSFQKQLEDNIQRINQEREEEIHRMYEDMEKTWLNHEEMVESTLRNICRQHNIEYCDKEKFPYSGKPDNSVVICNQYVIFDAKSPKDSENLENFPSYIKSQAQNIKKYVKGDDIKREVFLVVPTNAITSLPEVVYRIGEVRVYVITYDSMEPIILALKKIEEYTFAEQLSPEDRENICQVIGKFVHASKRKIQIDTFFSKLFIELLENCDSSLPQNIQEKLDEIEKSEIMNPPSEQRNKMTPLPGLVKSVKVLEKEAEAREIDMTAVTKDKIEKITLNKFFE